jgi:hypothetical protein
MEAGKSEKKAPGMSNSDRWKTVQKLRERVKKRNSWARERSGGF